MYGKLFLLFLAIGLILLGASGKGRAIWEILTNKADSIIPPDAPTQGSNHSASDWDKHSESGAADGGVRT